MSKFLRSLQRGLARVGLSLLHKAREEFNSSVKSGEYNLAEKIIQHEWNADRSGWQSREWYKKYVRENKDIKFKGIMEDGKIYNFRYLVPKTKDTLAFWDTDPVVLCLGHYISKAQDIIEVGINLHMLPLKVRQQVVITIFNIYSRQYKGQMYRPRQKPVFFKWKAIAKAVQSYGTAFAFRSYIPKRRTQAVEIKYEDWHNIVFLPSLKYQKIKFEALKIEWRKYTMAKSAELSQAQFEKSIAGIRI